MRYYKIIENDELMMIGKGKGGIEITKNEYEALLEELKKIPFIIPLSALDDTQEEE